jgi:thiol:disulfide interchange protein
VKFLLRLIAAAVLLFATYNPEGRSYFHWMADGGWAITPLKAFVGVCLLAGWVFLLRATVHSLGALGTLLAAAFFGTLIWLIVSWAHLEPTTSKGLTYLILIGIAAVLSTGSVFSIWRRKVTGQVDVDEQAE